VIINGRRAQANRESFADSVHRRNHAVTSHRAATFSTARENTPDARLAGFLTDPRVKVVVAVGLTGYCQMWCLRNDLGGVLEKFVLELLACQEQGCWWPLSFRQRFKQNRSINSDQQADADTTMSNKESHTSI